MAFRSRYIKKRFMKKKPRFTRRFKRGYTSIKNKEKTYFFKRTMATTYSITDSWNNLNRQIRLADIPNYTDFTGLYDQYKICGIKETFVFDKSEATVGSAASQILPNLYFVYDSNSSGASLSNETAALEYQNCRIRRMDKPIKKWTKTNFLTSANSGGSDVLTVKGKGYVSTASTSVNYYGSLFAVDGAMAGGTGTNTLGQLKVFTTFYLAFKTPK